MLNSARTNLRLIAIAIACVIIGTALSRRLEPGVRVNSVTLAGKTPALQFLPADSGPHPVALLAHGVTASKETLFRFGEALAAAGFDAYAVDLPGHGQSRQRFGTSWHANAQTLQEVTKSIGPVDVFIGHSMGAYAVSDAELPARLYIAVGANPEHDEHEPPLLLLSGQLDEAVPPSRLKARTDARIQLFSWCDHAFEPYDPHLVDAAVAAACLAVGKTPPPSPTRWIWRLTGTMLGLLGALALTILLPKLPPRWALARGPLVSAIIIAAVILTTSTWFGAAPNLRRTPLQATIIIIALLAIMGAAKLHIPRWIFAPLFAAIAIGFAINGAYFFLLLAAIAAVVLFAGTVLGWIASHRGSPRDGDIAMALLVGYAAGQCLPMIF